MICQEVAEELGKGWVQQFSSGDLEDQLIHLTPNNVLFCCREFLNSWLPRFREENPHLEIAQVLKRGGHPFLEAAYSELPPPLIFGCLINFVI